MKLSIRETADLLNVSLQTLRRWDNDKTLRSGRLNDSAHRSYEENEIEDFLSCHFKYLLDLGQRWAVSERGFSLPAGLYCADRSVFKARLSRLEALLMQRSVAGSRYSLVTSIVGEIGNNSFDHNLGNWPDMPGTFFGYALNAQKIVLADRGQGILTTLKRVRPDLGNDRDALKTAFTEQVSGRAPEARGNGLKYVRGVVGGSGMNLLFRSGRATLSVSGRAGALNIAETADILRGCLAVIEY